MTAKIPSLSNPEQPVLRSNDMNWRKSRNRIPQRKKLTEMSLVSKWMITYNRSTNYYAQIQILGYQLCCSILVGVTGDACILWDITHTGKKKILRKKPQSNSFTAVCDMFLFILLWYFDWSKQIFSMKLVTVKHAQVLDESTKSMRSLNDSQLLCSVLDMDHKVVLRTLSLPVEWLKS